MKLVPFSRSSIFCQLETYSKATPPTFFDVMIHTKNRPKSETYSATRESLLRRWFHNMKGSMNGAAADLSRHHDRLIGLSDGG